MSQIYIIESIRNHDGTSNEREARRKGQRVELLSLHIGEGALLCYRDDHNAIVRTSPVENVLPMRSGVGLQIYTCDSVYMLRREGERYREEDSAI